ncbi:glycosyltransferase family 61 protein [Wenxinia marina]|uniref:Glycosyltransferase 61 catalytic domain-containing protein n=1 Tax=Wenxinia marina DSM 24838 TaxID=1123501 RepID=A0A0D0Q498_9RHOB|nr:glycosyltransferase family 61 protein [Wenxinia marina]KIQ69354.1 hypothetical protein Wenmar_01716 [Wenxinia marina DSM 24838]GGL57670.1 hypothetical protein GCM10011392_10120 [Wenxinia marina]
MGTGTASAPTVPDLSGSIADRIDLIEGAFVVPPAKGLGNRSVQRSGVLTPDGALVENSVTWRGMAQVTMAPAMPEGDIADLPGTWMFLGPLFGHFGHFLVESISRIWAYGALKDRIDGVLYVPKFQNRPGHVMNVYRPFLQALGVDCEMRNIEDPTRVERLYVPGQGFGMFQMIEGAPEFRDFVRAHAGKGIAPQGAEKIYVSRSALPPVRGSILGEALLEERLKAEGYEVFHPQKHSHAEQIAAYRAARQVIAVDCSPLHLLALVGHADQKVAVIARRDGHLDDIFARQIRAFQGAEATAIDLLRRNWIEEHASGPSRTSWGEIDFAELGRRLNAAGLIAGGLDWPDLTDAQIAAEVARISDGVGVPFRPWAGPPGTAPVEEE